MRNKILQYNSALKATARKLRKESTLSEVLLWKQIRRKALGVAFHRRVPIDSFIVDFYCHELRLAIEVDGSSHDDEQVYANDIMRQEKLESLGVHFIRINDRDVKRDMVNVIRELEGVIEYLKNNSPFEGGKGDVCIT